MPKVGETHAASDTVCGSWHRADHRSHDSFGAGQLDRTVLPIAEPKPPTYSELDARNAKPPPRFEVKAPKGAPNVVIVLIDDIGFGGPSTFGGPIRTPTMDHLPSPACASTTSTPPRCAHRRATRSRPAATTTRSILARSWRPRRPSPATPGRIRTVLRRWRKCCGSTATAPAHSASGTKRPPGRPACRDHSIAGRRTRASTSSTDSSAAKPTSGIRSSMTA